MSAAKNRSLDRPPSFDTAPDDGGNELQRVREILFGEQAKSTGQQIAALERRMDEQLTVLRRDLLAALGEQAAAQQSRFDAAIAETKAAGQKGRETLQADVLRQQNDLQQKLNELRDSKLDRDALAGLLGGLAARLGKSAKDAG